MDAPRVEKTLRIGGAPFTIEASEHGGVWRATARDTNGHQYGPAFTDSDAEGATSRAERWLVWQREHEEKLRALQDAEQVYHRTIAASAFVSESEGPSATELQADALHRLERARRALDAVRADKPE